MVFVAILTISEFLSIQIYMPNKNIIALIGMSNIGKSYWAKRLVSEGYVSFSIDDIIATKFADHTMQDVSSLARWMGQPWEEGFEQREQIYLELENKSVLEVLSQIDSLDINQKVVIDTTGSMFYLPQSTIDSVVKVCQMVYLIAPEHVKQKLLQKYIDQPKPVIWGGMFMQNSSETRGQSLARSYEKLLEWRSEKYAKYAEIVIDYDSRFKPRYTTEEFLKQIN